MNAVLFNDDEYVDMILEEQAQREREGKPVSTRPSLAGWDTKMSAMAVMIDRLAAIVESNSASPKAVRPYARPETAFERADRRKQQAVHEHLVAGLLPSG